MNTPIYRYINIQIFALLFLVMGMVGEGYGQRVYATSATYSGVGEFVNSSRAISVDGVTMPNVSLFANVTVKGDGGYSDNAGVITLRFNGVIPANSSVFIRVSGVTSAATGSIAVRPYMGSVATGVSSGDLITLSNGDQYYRAFSNAEFNSVQLAVTGKGGLLGGLTFKANIHHVFSESSSARCAEVLGYNVSSPLLTSISNPGNAIDNNLSTFSVFDATLNLGGALKHIVYFSGISNPGDAATVTFSYPPAVLSLTLLDNLKLTVYNGSAIVETKSLSSLISLDLLGLLSNGSRYTVSFMPSAVFDRLEVSFSGISLLAKVNLHEVQRTPAKPDVPKVYPAVEKMCFGSSANLTAAATSVGSVLRWYSQVNDGVILHQGSPYVTDPITTSDTTFLYVAAAWSANCPAESERVKVAVLTNPLPTITLTTPVNNLCQEDKNIFLSYNGPLNSPNQYSIIWNDSPIGFTDYHNLELLENRINISIPGDANAGTYTGIIKVKNTSTNCENNGEPFTIVIRPKPPAPVLNINPNSQY